MAANPVSGTCVDERRLLALANTAELAWTTGVEHAPRRQIQDIRQFPAQAKAPRAPILEALILEARIRREERFGVRMMRSRKHPFRRTDLHQPSEIQDRDAIR